MTAPWTCITCGNEYPPGSMPDVCLICVDERQYVPAEGQRWAPLDPDEIRTVTVRDPEPGLSEFTIDPAVGIGQRTFLVHTSSGNVLWEPPGFIGPDLVRRLRAAGPICAIVSSNPHLVGASVSLSHLLGEAPVYINPNLIPLSPRLVRQIAGAVDTLTYDRIYGAFGDVIYAGAGEVVRASADRYIGWLTDRIRDPDEPEQS